MVFMSSDLWLCIVLVPVEYDKMEGDCFSDQVVYDSNFCFATSVCPSVSSPSFPFPHSDLLMEFIGKAQKVTSSELPLRNGSPRSLSP